MNEILFLGFILVLVVAGLLQRKLAQVESALRKLQENQKIINDLENKLETSHVKVPVETFTTMVRYLANSIPNSTTIDAVADLMEDITTKE